MFDLVKFCSVCLVKFVPIKAFQTLSLGYFFEIGRWSQVAFLFDVGSIAACSSYGNSSGTSTTWNVMVYLLQTDRASYVDFSLLFNKMNEKAWSMAEESVDDSTLQKSWRDVARNVACKRVGPHGDLNPGPPAPKAGIIPLDQADDTITLLH